MTQQIFAPIVRIPRVETTNTQEQVSARVALMLTASFFVGATVAAVYALYAIPFT